MKFKDRRHAGELLAENNGIPGKNPLIWRCRVGGGGGTGLGFYRRRPRLIITRKIGAPCGRAGHRYGYGDGCLLNHKLVEQLGVTPSYIERAAASEQADTTPPDPTAAKAIPAVKGRVVIVVDDGVAGIYRQGGVAKPAAA